MSLCLLYHTPFPCNVLGPLRVLYQGDTAGDEGGPTNVLDRRGFICLPGKMGRQAKGFTLIVHSQAQVEVCLPWVLLHETQITMSG